MTTTTEHRRLLAAYTTSARQTVDAMVALLAFEAAARSAGQNLCTRIEFGLLKIPVGCGMSLNLRDEADALDRATRKARSTFF
jgi:hypothetical protein